MKNFKICNFACSNPARVRNALRFALSLTVSEISANLKFLNLKILIFFLNFRNVQKWFAVILYTIVIPKFCPFRSISYGFWVLNFNFKIDFFFKWPPFGQFLPDFCQKLISASFKYTGCSYRILNCLIQTFGLHCDHKIFLKLLNF